MTGKMRTATEIKALYEQAGQDHVFKFYDELAHEDQVNLLSQLTSIQVDKLSPLLKAALSSENDSSTASIEAFAGPIGRSSSDAELVSKSRSVGLEAISKGQVAALVLAGGQGTRLGFDGPKGMFDIGLPSRQSLFQLMAERIKKLIQLAGGASVPFYIMTSPLNHQDTISYFREKKFFGLGEENVYFFQQGMLPCLTEEVKIIMESKEKVAMAPDGNGGLYPSLLASGALDDMSARGILFLHVFSVDNALIRPADPVFVGYCISQKADCGNKVVWKAHAHEKVGVIAARGSKPCVVEYSEITTEMAEQTDGDSGILLFGAGNICNHFYTLNFIRDKILPNMGSLYHVARKRIPYYDEELKSTVTPKSNNGIKLEMFIFDVFPLSERMAILEVAREEEFAPVKNAAGSPTDSPDTAREMISALSKKWIKAAGGELIGDVDSTCEITPSTSYSGEGMEALVQEMGGQVSCPFMLSKP